MRRAASFVEVSEAATPIKRCASVTSFTSASASAHAHHISLSKPTIDHLVLRLKSPSAQRRAHPYGPPPTPRMRPSRPPPKDIPALELPPTALSLLPKNSPPPAPRMKPQVARAGPEALELLPPLMTLPPSVRPATNQPFVCSFRRPSVPIFSLA